MRKGILPMVIVALIVISVAGFFYKRYHVPPAIDHISPALSLIDLNGNTVSLSKFGGHPLFISYFATWCGPCLKEMPSIIALKIALSDKHLAVICISDEPIEKLRYLGEKYRGQLIFLHSQTSLHDIGIYTYPTNYIYDAKGKKIYDKVNPDNWADPELSYKISKQLN